MADSALQKAPLGLLGALDLKTLGVNPSFFGEMVRPSFDVIDFYLAPQLACEIADNAAALVQGDAAVLQVPVGQVWRVLSVQATLVFATGTASADPLGIGVVCRPTQAGATVRLAVLNQPPVAAVAASKQFAAGGAIPPILFGPGSQIFAQLENTISVASNLRVGALFQRILV